MTTSYAPLIRSLREAHEFSQAFVAEKLGLSRASYMAVESGKRELTLEEAQRIGPLLGVTLSELSRSIVPKFDKYKQMLLAYLRIFATLDDGKIPKTKLAKLLYLADFAWYYENLESMSGTMYVRRSYGPVPDEYFRALSELEIDGMVTIENKGDAMLVSLGAGARKPSVDLLTEEEITLMRDIAKKWQDKKTSEIVEFTHRQLPYLICKPDEVIPYELITQEDPGYVY